MIKKLHIENFRNIKSLDLSFEEMTSIITGKNNIGKSNTLNALMWFLTDTLLTDKWGAGENDIISIIPINHTKGEHTLVTVTLDSGAEFTKLYKRGYDKATGKPNKHTTEYKINGATCANSTEFTDALFSKNQLEYTARIKNAKDIKELNLMIDPLYALQKLDSKSLRLLLVELGCSVTKEEVFESDDKFEILKLDETKYLGDFTRMRVDLKQKKKLAEDDIKASEVLLQSVNEVEEYSESSLKELEDKAAGIRLQIKELSDGDITSLIKDLNLSKKKIEIEKKSFVDTETAKKEAQIKLLNEKISIAKAEAEKSKFEAINSLNSQINNLNQAKHSLEARKINYELVRANCKKEYAQAINDAQILANELANYKAKVCPHCGKSFAPDQSAYDKFNEVKNSDINRLQDNLTQTEIKINENKKKQEEIAKDGANAYEEINKINEEIANTDSQILEIQEEINKSYQMTVDYTELNNLNEELMKVKNTQISTTQFDEELIQIQATIDRTILDSRKANEDKIVALESELELLKPQIENEYMNKSRWASKQKYRSN